MQKEVSDLKTKLAASEARAVSVKVRVPPLRCFGATQLPAQSDWCKAGFKSLANLIALVVAADGPSWWTLCA
jgi:hypothetical protein